MPSDASSSDRCAGPIVSVCIPTLGRRSLVEVALPSILSQEQVDQVVVAFDGAHRSFEDPLLGDPRVLVVQHGGDGVAAGRNAAAAAATGEVLYFLDDDDEAAPGGLATLCALLADDAGFASGAVDITRPDGSREQWRPADQGFLFHHVHGLFLAGSFVVRRSVFEAAGRYREDLRFGENYDLGVRIGAVLAEQGLAHRWTDQVVMRWYQSTSSYAGDRAHAAGHLLDAYAHRLALDRAEHAKYLALAGVEWWREGDHRAARRFLRRALRAAPGDPRHWYRLALAMVPPLADRRWSAPDQAVP